MTGFIPLDWAILTVSLFNTILLLWLGLTVLLTTERRSLGVWVLGAGLLLGAAFFISHTAILGGGLPLFSSSLDFWWRSGWLPVITAPLAWYGMILWFAGFWSPAAGKLRRRHRLWPGFMAVFMLILLIVLYVGHGLPTFLNIAQLNLSGILTIGGLPVLLVLYPVYMVMCVGLAVDTLRHPARSERFMGDIARQRTYPWLLAASITLLVVSLLVGWFMLWAVGSTRAPGYDGPSPTIIASAAWFDIGIQLLIAVAVVFIGQAIVSYEIFTGKSLPRREFFRHWRDALILAGGYAFVVGGSLTLNLNPIYSLLLTTVLMVAFYALFSWRSFVHRDQFMEQLRPFVDSQNLVEQITSDEAKSTANTIFQALCDDVLNTILAQLVPGPPLADLVGKPLTYPPGASQSPVPTGLDLSVLPQANITALPDPVDGFQWAVGLWAARGLVGVLLLGDKRDGGVYTQEEIEIAQATSERILDMLAGEETARRLMAIQRKRLTETQILDHQTRRALHDEVLPALHTAILDVAVAQESAQTVATLTALHRRISDLIHTHPGVTFGESSTDLLVAIKAMLKSEFSHAFASVTWEGSGDLAGLEPLVQEVLFYAVRESVRNAALHGRGGDPNCEVNLKIAVAAGQAGVTVRIEDDGIGIPDKLGLTGQGGLALHSTMLALLGGTMTWKPVEPSGTHVEISLPNQGID
jgi:signal transduction histidine kinase